VNPREGELWEFTQSQRVRVGSKIATYLLRPCPRAGRAEKRGWAR